jgi:hypothetical protein
LLEYQRKMIFRSPWWLKLGSQPIAAPMLSCKYGQKRAEAG